MNTTIITAPGLWSVDVVSLESAQQILKFASEWTSAIGHESTAKFLEHFLAVKVPFQRLAIAPVQGDEMLCIKLAGRLPEGKVLALEEMQSIKFNFFHMCLIDTSGKKPDLG